MLDYVMFDVSRVTYMAGWIEIEIAVNLLVIFKQLYHSNINVFYYVHWIGLCIKIIVFYTIWITNLWL